MTGLRRMLVRRSTPFLLLSPTLILILAINIYPLLTGIHISFCSSTLLKPFSFRCYETTQYIKLVNSEGFWSALTHSIIWTVLSVILSYGIGLGLALLLNREIKGRGIMRAILLVPWVIPSVVTSVLWKVMYASFGPINAILQGVGLTDEPVLWLGNPSLALISVTLVNVWRDYPFTTVTLLAGLQTIPSDLYEAAQIDGATVWQRFWRLTFPLLAPVSIITTILLTVWSFNNFDLVFLITGGGPSGATEVLPTMVFLETFRRQNPAFAASIATLMLVVMLIFTVLYMRVYRRAAEA
jgi:multiple sugar transport system permease protein